MDYGGNAMDELALNILDIAYNSIRAHATYIHVDIDESIKKNYIKIVIDDNGDGMDEQTIKHVIDPFYTTRTTRNVGLGIPLFKEAAEATGGYLDIQSSIGKGTTITAQFVKNHIDTPVMGNIIDTMITLIQAHDNIDYDFQYDSDENQFTMSTKEMKEILGDVKMSEPEVLMWLKDYMKEGLRK